MTRLLRCLCAALPLALSAQQPVQLGKPIAEFPEAFTRVATLRELKDGRVLVVDEREGGIRLLDFTSGAMKPVGRTGAGPAEYARAGRLVALPGDSSALHDPGNARYLVIKPDGTPGETFMLDERVRFTLGGRGSVPRGTDARGYIYFQGAPLTTGSGDTPPVPLDSAPVMRYDRRTAKLDTLAWLQFAKGNTRVAPGPDGRGLSITVGAHAYPANDDWGVMPDGSIAVVRAKDYHVDRYSITGTRTQGSPVRATPVPVTETEKEAWRSERRGRAVSRTTGAIATNFFEPEWPVSMPPFALFSTFASPKGELWVLRSHKAADAPVYDVFNATGSLSSRVALPARTRLVGFGNGTVYLVRRDDDDLEWLQRYRLP